MKRKDNKNNEIKTAVEENVLEIIKSYKKMDIETLEKAKIASDIGINYLNYLNKAEGEQFGQELLDEI